MVELIKVYDYYDENTLEILSINIDENENWDDVFNFKQQFLYYYGYSLDWTFGMEIDNNLENYMPDGGIPTICIFDRYGNHIVNKSGIAFYDEIPDGFPSNLPKPLLLKEEIDKII